ncbi:MAG: DnaA regulatory inactivator Hda [Pseudomonadota bacterium]
MKQIALDMGLASPPSFANFFAGPNEAALRHVELWAGNPLRSPVPTYLWGDSGSGKTHLLKAVARSLQQQDASFGWLDAACEGGEFRESWNVVLMDDCHLYTASQQQTAFNWFVNALSAADGGPRWVLASGALPPSDLQLREDLRTRLGWGHVFALQALTENERRAVLRQEADARGVFLSDEAMDFILTRFSRDLGNLMQLLDQLDGYSLQTQRPITIPLIKSMLENQ